MSGHLITGRDSAQRFLKGVGPDKPGPRPEPPAPITYIEPRPYKRRPFCRAVVKREDVIADMVDRYQSGESCHAVAAAFHVCHATAARWLREEGVVIRDSRRRAAS